MDYGRLINRAFALAWKHKILWILGLFTAAGGSALNFGDTFSDSDRSQFFQDLSRGFSDYDSGFEFPTEALVPLAGAMLVAFIVIGLIFLIAKLIAIPALIDAVNNITRGGQFSFGNSVSRGIDLFWRFLGLFFIQLFAIFVTVMVCGVISLILILTIIGIPVAILLIMFVIYFWYTLFSLAERAIVVRNCSIGDGLNEGWSLFKANIGSTMMIALINIGFGIAFSIITLIAWLIMGLPVGGITYAITSSPVAALILGILIGLPVSLVIGGFTGTFFESLYTMYYFELVEPTPVTVDYNDPPAPPSVGEGVEPTRPAPEPPTNPPAPDGV